jgi:hypothetical protein
MKKLVLMSKSETTWNSITFTLEFYNTYAYAYCQDTCRYIRMILWKYCENIEEKDHSQNVSGQWRVNKTSYTESNNFKQSSRRMVNLFELSRTEMKNHDILIRITLKTRYAKSLLLIISQNKKSCFSSLYLNILKNDKYYLYFVPYEIMSYITKSSKSSNSSNSFKFFQILFLSKVYHSFQINDSAIFGANWWFWHIINILLTYY